MADTDTGSWRRSITRHKRRAAAATRGSHHADASSCRSVQPLLRYGEACYVVRQDVAQNVSRRNALRAENGATSCRVRLSPRSRARVKYAMRGANQTDVRRRRRKRCACPTSPPCCSKRKMLQQRASASCHDAGEMRGGTWRVSVRRRVHRTGEREV